MNTYEEKIDQLEKQVAHLTKLTMPSMRSIKCTPASPSKYYYCIPEVPDPCQYGGNWNSRYGDLCPAHYAHLKLRKSVGLDTYIFPEIN
jgi:hypothetical protein